MPSRRVTYETSRTNPNNYHFPGDWGEGVVFVPDPTPIGKSYSRYQDDDDADDEPNRLPGTPSGEEETQQTDHNPYRV